MDRVRAVIAMVLFVFGVTVARPATAAGRDGGVTIVAVVQSVDVLDRTVTVVDTWGIAREFDLSGGAKVFRAEDSTELFTTLDDVEAGDRVKVTCTGTLDDPGAVSLTILRKH